MSCAPLPQSRPAFAFPERTTFDQLEQLVGGNMSLPLMGDTWVSLDTVDIRQVLDDEPEFGGKPFPPCDADGFRRTGYNPDRYRALEAEINKRGAEHVPPIIVRRELDGTLVWIDGYHRISLALNAGITHMRAYVWDRLEDSSLHDVVPIQAA
jgi:hypothetical protein